MNIRNRFWFWLGLLMLAASGCTASSGGSTGQQPAAVLGIDPTHYVILEFERTGGIAGFDDRAQLFMDGHVVLARHNAPSATFQLSQAEQSQVQAALDAADFYRQAAQPQATAAPAVADGFQYRIYRRGLMLQGEVFTQDGSIPVWVEPLLPLLTQLLLQPDPARLATATPVTFSAPAASPNAATAAAPALLLLEYARNAPDDQLRLLVYLDRSYSLARNGRVSEGTLSRDEMAALLQLLEAADLKTRGGQYMADPPCSTCTTYQIVYRNLLGQGKVSGQSGALPEWLEILTATLEAGFAMPDAAVAFPGGTITATQVAPVMETATPQDFTYGVQDLLADIVHRGLSISGPTERVTKPYLSADGVALLVQGEPVQVFRYADVEALAADIAGLAPDASSINGRPLSWAATPYFWQRGDMLVLAVTNNPVVIEMMKDALGEPFAWRQPSRVETSPTSLP
ncbi:MAG: hypothetical protein ABTQ73_03660 [Caldilineales bacterium]